MEKTKYRIESPINLSFEKNPHWDIVMCVPVSLDDKQVDSDDITGSRIAQFFSKQDAEDYLDWLENKSISS